MIWYKDWVFYLMFGCVFIFDQLSKELIKLWMPLGDSWPSTGFLRIVHGTNTGSAFGLFAGFTNLLIFASIIGIVAVLYYYQSCDDHHKSFLLFFHHDDQHSF